MKIIFLHVICLLLLSRYGRTAQPQAVDWKAVQRAFATYDEDPSGENATKLTKLLPADHVKYTGEKNEQDCLTFIYDHFGMVQRQVISRDSSAVKLAFRLKTVADGGFAEDLDVTLGELIRIDPRLFLINLRDYKDTARLDSLVGNLGDVYTDKPKAQLLEISKRIEALQQVKEPDLRSIRNRCTEELKRVRSEIAEHIDE